ncbi:MAG TPA: ABC transporter ATP-binding protein, partial [Anaerolineae bacterium]|nr:ABC transporter ATP-binding protein [Anaerolineae bacterium]
ALRGVSLEIGPGMFGLVGPNGAGKTTLMRILAGLVRPTGGSVRVLGHDVTKPAGKKAVKAALGYLPQELGLYPNLSAYEFMDYVASLKGLTDSAGRRRQIEELLERVGLADVAQRQIGTYSGGMKRRVGVAQALLGSPRLLIVDEPTAGLDPEERVRLRNLLAEMSSHCTVLLSTHIVEDISQSCSELACLCEGQVLFRGSPRELIAAARGKVWLIATNGERPDSDLQLVSMLQLDGGMQYRVLGDPAPDYRATAVEPSLEDGYIWLMRRPDAAQRQRIGI